jgi:hypothetical protein
MEYNNIIKKQLMDYIKQPAILVNKDDVPYEYRDGGSVARLKRRRANVDIPYQLYEFIVENNITRNQLREFGSGLFLNYVETSKIYT